MYPIPANGGSQAIRDGSALADAFSVHDDPTEALAAYERERRETVNQIVITNRQLGPEEIMQLAHESAPGGFERVEDVLTKEELEAVSRKYNKVTRALPSGSMNAN